MATIYDLLPEVRKIVKNCPDVTSLYALRKAVRKFCRESWIYQKSLQLPIYDSQDAYQISFPNGDELIGVYAVQWDNFVLTPARPEDVYTNSFLGSTPYIFIFEPPDILMLRPIPTDSAGANPGVLITDHTCSLRLILQPNEQSDLVPEVIYRYFKEEVAAGAVSDLLNMPEEKWTNHQLAQQHALNFQYGYGEARRMRERGFSPRNTRIIPKSWLKG